MFVELGNTLIAVLAAFGGAVLNDKLQRRNSRDLRVEDHRRADENEAKKLVAQTVTALDDHRSAMVALESNRHEKGKYKRADVTRTHRTRSALSAPLALLSFVDESLGAKAETAATTTYAMYRSKDLKDLEERRLAAHGDTQEFKNTAVARFTAAGASFVLPDTGDRASLSEGVR